MNTIALAQQQLGPLAWPLLACAALTVLILLERCAVLGYYSFHRRVCTSGMAILEQHRDQPKALREEIAAIWLQRLQQRLSHGIRLLHMMATIAPLLGLLGTVIGLIQVFDDLAAHQGPIEPALLARGLGIAMKTTAAGLVIAMPAVLGAHGFQLWVDRLVSRSEHCLNIGNLRIDDVCTKALA